MTDGRHASFCERHPFVIFGAASVLVHYVVLARYVTHFPHLRFNLPLLLPFLLVGIICADLARLEGRKVAYAVFLCFQTLLCILYYAAYQASFEAASERLWTSATLTVAVLPLKAVPVMAGCILLWIYLKLRR
jgi:NhaP-type Na+/H+ and K+/H+ antiporter